MRSTSSNNPIGIRTAPYTNYTRTYGLVVGLLGPHLDGEIYAATMWRLRQLWLSNGWSQDTLMRYVVDGMSYTAPKPAYEDMRDGILSSIANMSTEVDPDAARCTVWNAFAQFGIGVGADGYEICAIGLCFFKATESFTLPAECPAGPPPNTAPVVAISQPQTGTSVTQGTSVTFTGSASDAEDGNLSASLSWSSSIDGVIGSGASFSTSSLSAGTHVVTASVTDGGGLSGSAGIVVIVNAASNTAPVVSITAPSNGSSFVQGASIGFAGSANDTEEGNLSASLVWTSSLAPFNLGTGASIFRSDLAVGTHIITASVTDGGGLSGQAQVAITVTVTPQVNITLTASGYKVKGSEYVDLSWGGATTPVDVFRNGTRIATATPNDGAFTDATGGKGKGTFTYRVCNTGTSTCSSTATVSF